MSISAKSILDTIVLPPLQKSSPKIGILASAQQTKLQYPTRSQWLKSMIDAGKINKQEMYKDRYVFSKGTGNRFDSDCSKPFTMAKSETDQVKLQESHTQAEILKRKTPSEAHSSNLLSGHKATHFINMEKSNNKKSQTSMELSPTSMRKCPLPLYVILQREMCRLNYGIVKKKEEMENLGNKATSEEQALDSAFKQIEIDKEAYDSQITKKCRKTTKAIRKADRMTKQRSELCDKINKVTFQYAHLNTSCLKLEDTLQNLMKYRKFIDMITPSELKRNNQDNQLTFKLNEYQKFEDVNVRNIDDEASTVNQSWVTKCDSTKDGDLLDAPLYFKDPQEMADILMELEESNLKVIQNVQEQEESCEETRTLIKIFKAKTKEENEILNKNIKKSQEAVSKLDNEIKTMQETLEFLDSFKQLSRYKTMFHFGNHGCQNIHQMLAYLHQTIKDCYEAVFGLSDAELDCQRMLKRIEARMDAYNLQSQQYPKRVLQRVRDQFYETKRQNARKRQLEKAKLLQEDKLRRAEAKAKMPMKKRYGRPLMFRSPPPRKTVKETENDRESFDMNEELTFFFEE